MKKLGKGEYGEDCRFRRQVSFVPDHIEQWKLYGLIVSWPRPYNGGHKYHFLRPMLFLVNLSPKGSPKN